MDDVDIIYFSGMQQALVINAQREVEVISVTVKSSMAWRDKNAVAITTPAHAHLRHVVRRFWKPFALKALVDAEVNDQRKALADAAWSFLKASRDKHK